MSQSAYCTLLTEHYQFLQCVVACLKVLFFMEGLLYAVLLYHCNEQTDPEVLTFKHIHAGFICVKHRLKTTLLQSLVLSSLLSKYFLRNTSRMKAS